jgi:hypothetical protein
MLRTGEIMNMGRGWLLSLISIGFAIPAFAQTQMACRDLKESGGYLYQGATVINGQACRQITYAP